MIGGADGTASVIVRYEDGGGGNGKRDKGCGAGGEANANGGGNGGCNDIDDDAGDDGDNGIGGDVTGDGVVVTAFCKELECVLNIRAIFGSYMKTRMRQRSSSTPRPLK
jgi:hypothetical protein